MNIGQKTVLWGSYLQWGPGAPPVSCLCSQQSPPRLAFGGQRSARQCTQLAWRLGKNRREQVKNNVITQQLTPHITGHFSSCLVSWAICLLSTHTVSSDEMATGPPCEGTWGKGAIWPVTQYYLNVTTHRRWLRLSLELFQVLFLTAISWQPCSQAR